MFSLISNHEIVKISEYADPKTKRALTLLDRRTRAVVLEALKWLRVCPPDPYSSLSFSVDILANVIQRHPALEKLTVGPGKDWYGNGEFRVSKAPYLESLISYLKEHPLKKIEFREIVKDPFVDSDREATQKLNADFLEGIGHPLLKKVRVVAHHLGSVLTGAEIQPVLDRSPNLKTFVFSGFQSDQSVSLSFAGQPQLTRVKLLSWIGNASTLESLKACDKLEKFAISCNFRATVEFRTGLLRNLPKNLKRLDLSNLAPQNDEELDALTKTLPNLESLSIDLGVITDDGMELLGNNCRNLRALHFNSKNLTDSGLARLTQNLPHLEILNFNEAYNVTEAGITYIALNCLKLRVLRVLHYRQIEKAGLDDLAKHCPQLEAVEFSHGGPISFEGVQTLTEQSRNLRYVQLNSIQHVSDNEIEALFYQKFPGISKIKNLAKLLRLP